MSSFVHLGASGPGFVVVVTTIISYDLVDQRSIASLKRTTPLPDYQYSQEPHHIHQARGAGTQRGQSDERVGRDDGREYLHQASHGSCICHRCHWGFSGIEADKAACLRRWACVGDLYKSG